MSPNNNSTEGRHAGAVGPGPELGQGPIVMGVEQQIYGKIYGKPEKAAEGRARRKGALKDNAVESGQQIDPFSHGPSSDAAFERAEEQLQSRLTNPQASHVNTATTGEAAGVVAPDGTKKAEKEKRGIHDMKSIG